MRVDCVSDAIETNLAIPLSIEYFPRKVVAKESAMSSTSFFTDLRDQISELGGILNAHLHLDRSGTYDATLRILRDAGQGHQRSSLSLARKHSLIPLIHASDCYDPASLKKRVRVYLETLVRAGTTRADSLVDVTVDRVKLTALEVFLELKQEFQAVLDFRVGAYSPLGFKDTEPERWSLLEEAAVLADFVGGLPERDDRFDYPGHIGFEECCRRLVSLSEELGKPLHLHVDQKNMEDENGAERALNVIADLALKDPIQGASPLLWFVHMISSSAYDEDRFQRLLDRLVEHQVGVICCPSAAISMRQVRGVSAPTHNSIARVLEMLEVGIPVRIGSDNICDITSPAGTTDLVDELFVLCNSLRFYDEPILAKLGAGLPLSDIERVRVQRHLKNDREETMQAVSRVSRIREAA